MEEGANKTLTDMRRRTPLHYSVQHGNKTRNFDVTQVWQDQPSVIDLQLLPCFTNSVKFDLGHEGVTKLLIDNGADLNAKDAGGKGPLYNSAYFGNFLSLQKTMNQTTRLTYF